MDIALRAAGISAWSSRSVVLQQNIILLFTPHNRHVTPKRGFYYRARYHNAGRRRKVLQASGHPSAKKNAADIPTTASYDAIKLKAGEDFDSYKNSKVRDRVSLQQNQVSS
jgi:hypothetical protein